MGRDYKGREKAIGHYTFVGKVTSLDRARVPRTRTTMAKSIVKGSSNRKGSIDRLLLPFTLEPPSTISSCFFLIIQSFSVHITSQNLSLFLELIEPKEPLLAHSC